MHGITGSCIKNYAVLVLLPWLFACSTSGMGSHQDMREERGGAAPPAVVQMITPQLVKSERERREQRVSQDITRLITPAKPYQIESGDVLSIVVWDHPELVAAAMTLPATGIPWVDQSTGSVPPSGFVVDHEGGVQFPYIGRLKLAGSTEEQARDLLTSKLAKYIQKPNITLRVQAFRSKRIYIDGEVKTPGLQAINDIPMTLVEALNRSGGVLPSGDQSQIVISRGGENFKINLPEMVMKGVDPASVMLAHGDVVRVLSRDESKVFVQGEVTTPRSLTMHNGRLSLNEALGESGGVNTMSGDNSKIFVVRKVNQDLLVYQLDASVAGALAMAEGFELQPKDVVLVGSTALTTWHRTISMILPGNLSQAVGVVHP